MSSEAVTAANEQETPRLLFFYDERSGPSRRAEGFLAQVLQRGGNHQTFLIHRIEVGQRPDLAERFKVTAAPTFLVVERKKVQARLESPTGCKDIELLLRPWLQSRSGLQPPATPQHQTDAASAPVDAFGAPV
jgi:thioredoxin-like negative regulator of GroEL